MKKVLSILIIFMLLLFCAAAAEENPTAESAMLPPYEVSVNDAGFDVGAGIASTVLYDGEVAVVTATRLYYDDSMAYLELKIENRSAASIQFDTGLISVNHLMKGFSDFSFIEPGQTITENIYFPYSDLLPNGVSVLSEITIGKLSLTLLDDDWKETIIGPLTLYTSAYGRAEERGTGCETILRADYQEQFSYRVMAFSQKRTDIAEGVYAAASSLIYKEFEEECLVIELHNDTEENVSVSLRNLTINGITLASGGYYSVDLAPHSYYALSVSLGGYGVPRYCFDTLGLAPVRDIAFDYALEQSGREPTAFIPDSLAIPDTTEPKNACGTVVYDKDGFTIRSFGIIPEYEEADYVGSVTVMMLFENNTGKNLTLQDNGTGALLLNGEEVGFYSMICTLPDKTVSAVCYTCYDSLTDDHGISSSSEINEGQMTLSLTNDENFSDTLELTFPLFGK